jgi:hypothetical protein
MDSTKIYLVSNIDYDQNKVYIGKTRTSNREKSHRVRFGNQIEFSIIDEVDSTKRSDWEPLESYWIEQFKQWGFKLLNKNKGGGGPEYHSEETKAKMGRRGVKKPGVSKALKGRTLTEEVRKKLSEARKGNTNAKGSIRSEEFKANLRKPKSEEFKANLRKPKSEEFKQKLRDYYKNKKVKQII